MSSEFCHNLSFWIISQFEVSFVAIWFLRFYHNLSFKALSQFQFLGFCQNFSFCFFTIWVFEFSHYLSFLVLSQLRFRHNLSIWVAIFSVRVLLQFKFLICHNLSFWVFTIWIKKKWVKTFFFARKKVLLKKFFCGNIFLGKKLIY